ncbi:class I SAM-dependent methyltransferase [Pedobacter sp.]|uniref:class I SAM-dependent methyltransferase n=1 Tax=Pedobacter sp. TaxID=1411316 RepID=UPI00396C5781
MVNFKDNFSKQADIYRQYRPSYPEELFSYLQSLTPEHDLAWDCGTGNGQSAIGLAKYFEQVYASDPSENQINNATLHDRIIYKVERAEHNKLNNHSVDLITVAQAIHWFDFDKFYKEAKRVLKPKGIIAVWTYGLTSITDEIDKITQHFHDHVVGDFWMPENKLVEQEYKTIPFPFKERSTPPFTIKSTLNLDDLLGYFRSWSATQKYMEKCHKNPLEQLKKELLPLWGDENSKREVTRKLILRVGQTD